MDKSESAGKEEAARLVEQGRAILEALSKRNALSAPQEEDLAELQRLQTNLAKPDTVGY
jgi:hypothetical protein